MSFWDNNKDTFKAAGIATAKGIGKGGAALGRAGVRTYKQHEAKRNGANTSASTSAEGASASPGTTGTAPGTSYGAPGTNCGATGTAPGASPGYGGGYGPNGGAPAPAPASAYGTMSREQMAALPAPPGRNVPGQAYVRGEALGQYQGQAQAAQPQYQQTQQPAPAQGQVQLPQGQYQQGQYPPPGQYE